MASRSFHISILPRRPVFHLNRSLRLHSGALKPDEPQTRILDPIDPQTPRVALVPAPRPGSAPLKERLPNRALPEAPQPWKIWAKTLPIFLLIVGAAAFGLFNYEKQSSSVVSSTMYALRMSDMGREELGDEIYFRDRFPWIWGQMNQLKGRIDIQFGVKGTKGRGMMRFRSERRQRNGPVSLDFFLLCRGLS